MTDTIISVPALHQRIADIFLRAGMSPTHSDALATVIVAGERDGCTSHGVYRVEGCLRTIKAGKVTNADPEFHDEGGAVLRVLAHGAYSVAGFAMGVPHLAERARTLGMAALVINDCVHFSALWPEIEMLTDRGLAAIAMCPSYSVVAPTGGRDPLFGTNPLAFGWPRRDAPPYVFDFATSVAARGEVELHRRAGKPIPEGWGIDADGQPTTSPEAALAGALLPFGGHKGSAISTMIELLAGAMIGDLTSAEALEELGDVTLAPRHGELILAFDPARLSAGRAGDPLDRAETVFDAILGQGARLPSQRRFAARAVSETTGITLHDAEMDLLDRLGRDGLAAV